MHPLDGIKILDFTRLLPGEYCSQLLADFGAEVIKIEDTGKGDYGRWVHPMICGTMIDETVSAYFASLNRNKKSIKLNMKDPAGKDIFLKLAKDADVVLESFRPGVMDRLGVGYETLKKIKAREKSITKSNGKSIMSFSNIVLAIRPETIANNPPHSWRYPKNLPLSVEGNDFPQIS